MSDPTHPASSTLDTSPTLWPERYDLIDAFRGLAALTVVCSHVAIPGSNGSARVLPERFGHFAVVIFFVISGYCITAAVESCLRRGLGLRQFMWRRVRRIFPPYVLAVLFFTATRILRYHLTGVTFNRPPLQWLQNVTLTQWLTLIVHPQMTSAANTALFVPAFWSLNYEEQFYLVMGLIMITAGLLHRRNVMIGLMLLGIGWNVVGPRACYGIFIEYWPLFALGSLIFYRLCRMKDRRARLLVDLFIAGLLVGGIVARVLRGPYKIEHRPLTEEYIIAGVFTLALVALRGLDKYFKAFKPSRLLMALGMVSYSLYLVHQFNLVLVETTITRLLPTGTPLVIWVAGVVVMHVSIASIFWFFCERPFLNRPIVPSSGRPSPLEIAAAGRAQPTP